MTNSCKWSLGNKVSLSYPYWSFSHLLSKSTVHCTFAVKKSLVYMCMLVTRTAIDLFCCQFTEASPVGVKIEAQRGSLWSSMTDPISITLLLSNRKLWHSNATRRLYCVRRSSLCRRTIRSAVSVNDMITTIMLLVRFHKLAQDKITAA